MTLDEYQIKAMTTAKFDKGDAINYCVLGLAGEAGEVAGKLAKSIRDKTELDTMAMAKELGDCLWMIAGVAQALGMNLGVVARLNLEKLADRQARGVIGGSGDNR